MININEMGFMQQLAILRRVNILINWILYGRIPVTVDDIVDYYKDYKDTLKTIMEDKRLPGVIADIIDTTLAEDEGLDKAIQSTVEQVMNILQERRQNNNTLDKIMQDIAV